jgi:hypothetical protein
MEQKSENMFDFLHCVQPQTDYEEGAWGVKGMPYSSQYISIQGRALLSEGGFRSFPYAVGRYVQTPMETYGRSPAMQVLPALKTLNAEKATFLKVGHRAADPTLLTYDDGLVDPTMKPGAINKGGMNADGKPLIGILPTGQIQVTKEMMDEERSLINDAFLVTLFQILTETPTMTATEVIERTNEKGILIAPTVGRQQSEYLGPADPPRARSAVADEAAAPDARRHPGEQGRVQCRLHFAPGTRPACAGRGWLAAHHPVCPRSGQRNAGRLTSRRVQLRRLDPRNRDDPGRAGALAERRRHDRGQAQSAGAAGDAAAADTGTARQAAMMKAQAVVQKAGGPPPPAGAGQPMQGQPGGQ